MNESTQKHQPDQTMAQQVTNVINAFQKQNTGHSPKAVTVVLSEDTLVITLHEVLSPAERALAKSAEGAAQVQEFHRQLFAASSKTLCEEIQRITGREVREAVAEVEPTTGVIVQAFTVRHGCAFLPFRSRKVHVFLIDQEKTSATASQSQSEPTS